jgi:hypothetical protein
MDATKEAYKQKKESEFKELTARLGLLESKADKAEAEAKIGYTEQIYELQEKRDHLREKIDAIKEGDGDAWEDMVKGIEEAATDFRTAIDVALTRFK